MIQICVYVHLDNTIVDGSLDFLSNGRRGIGGFQEQRADSGPDTHGVSFTHEGKWSHEACIDELARVLETLDMPEASRWKCQINMRASTSKYNHVADIGSSVVTALSDA